MNRKEYEDWAKYNDLSLRSLKKIETYLMKVGGDSRQSEIDGLKAEVERLRGLLKPFAAFAAHYPKTQTFGNRQTTGEWYTVRSGNGIPDAQLDVEDFHRAADALKEQK